MSLIPKKGTVYVVDDDEAVRAGARAIRDDFIRADDDFAGVDRK